MDERILILAPRGRDAPVIAETLANQGHRSLICANLAALIEALQENAGAAILTEEAMAQDGTETLSAWLAAQPSWSDFPFIVLVTKQPGKRTQADAARLQAMGNIVLLERPINAETLVSAAASAVRARPAISGARPSVGSGQGRGAASIRARRGSSGRLGSRS